MINKLTSIVSENWNLFSSSLDLELENKSENYLMMINELKPYIKLLEKIIEHPSNNSIVSKMKIGDPEYITLIKMGFLEYNLENESISIPYKSKEIVKGFYNLNHSEVIRKEKEKRELLKHIIENEKSW